MYSLDLAVEQLAREANEHVHAYEIIVMNELDPNTLSPPEADAPLTEATWYFGSCECGATLETAVCKTHDGRMVAYPCRADASFISE